MAPNKQLCDRKIEKSESQIKGGIQVNFVFGMMADFSKCLSSNFTMTWVQETLKIQAPHSFVI